MSELIGDNLTMKMQNLPEATRMKLKDTLTRMLNEGCKGLFCLMF